jgi:hypothetical protein
MFFAVTTSLNNPAMLFRSSLLAILPILILIRHPINFKIYKFISLIFLFIILIYTISWQLNEQSLGNFLFGAYNRNIGILALLGLFLLTLESAEYFSKFTQKLTKIFYTIAIFSIFYATLQLLGKDPIPWEKGAGFGLTLGNPNFSSSLLGILSVIPLSYTLNLKKPYRYLHLNVYIALLVLILQSNSSQGFLLYLLNSTVFIILRFDLLSKFLKIDKIYKVSSVLVIPLIPLFLVLNQNFMTYLNSMLQINHRLEHWKMGYRIWRDHVFFGVGIENISRFSGEYRGEIIRSWGQYTHPDKIHNAFIDNFVTGGIFVGFAWLIFVIYTFFVISKLLKATNLHSRKQSIYVLVSIWLTYLVQTLFSTDHMYLMTIGMLASGALIGIYIHEVKSLARSNFAKISN